MSDRFYFAFTFILNLPLFLIHFYFCYSSSAIFAVICSFVMPNDFNSSFGS